MDLFYDRYPRYHNNRTYRAVDEYFNIAKKVCKVDPISLTSKFKELDTFLDTVPCNKKADGTCEEINTCTGTGSG